MVIVNLIKHMQDHITCYVKGRTLATALNRAAGRGDLCLSVCLFFSNRSFLKD